MREHYTYCTCPTCLDEKTIPTVAPGTEPPRETRRSMAVIVYGAFAAGGALVGLVAGWVLRGMW